MPARRKTPTSRSTPSHAHAATGRCAVCGEVQGVARGYDIDDRLLRTLFLAVCKSMHLVPMRDDRTPTLVVTAPDVATQDQLEARFLALSAQLDDQLMALTVGFIREHCGLDVPLPVRPPS